MKKYVFLFFLFVVISFPLFHSEVFGHGNPGIDRAPPIDFEKRNVTVEARMNPS